MAKPDSRTYENMVAWADQELHPYIEQLIPGFISATLALSQTPDNRRPFARNLIGNNPHNKFEHLRDTDLTAFGELCAEIIARFGTNYLWSPPRSTRTFASSYKILAISHHFRANQYSNVWEK